MQTAPSQAALTWHGDLLSKKNTLFDVYCLHDHPLPQSWIIFPAQSWIILPSPSRIIFPSQSWISLPCQSCTHFQLLNVVRFVIRPICLKSQPQKRAARARPWSWARQPSAGTVISGKWKVLQILLRSVTGPGHGPGTYVVCLDSSCDSV